MHIKLIKSKYDTDLHQLTPFNTQTISPQPTTLHNTHQASKARLITRLKMLASK